MTNLAEVRAKPGHRQQKPLIPPATIRSLPAKTGASKTPAAAAAARSLTNGSQRFAGHNLEDSKMPAIDEFSKQKSGQQVRPPNPGDEVWSSAESLFWVSKD